MKGNMHTRPRLVDIAGTVDLFDPESVSSAIEKIYEDNYGNEPDKDFNRIEDIIFFVDRLFKGEVKGYQACDTMYHDLAHTYGTSLAMSRIFDGMNQFPADPNICKISRDMFELGVNSGTLHDTGYIKEAGDNEGTGAKYTSKHVERSADFVEKHAPELGFDETSVRKVKNIIRCTGIGLDISKIPFGSNGEKKAGLVLCTADFLSQMAASNYQAKLPILYEEFKEGKVPGFESAEDLMRKTPDFWRNYVIPKLEECKSVYKFLWYHFWGRNLYIDAIKENIKHIEQTYK